VALTSTSYAILGLLDIREWSAYELTQQARRSLAFIWPMSETQLYAEPKRLATEGLITITAGRAGPQRTRQQLRITEKGRRALRVWLATEPSAPRLQMEVLLRTLLATSGDKADLLAALTASRCSVQATYDEGMELVAAYDAGDNPFPERLHANILWMTYTHDLLVLTLRWIDFATAEVQRWDDAHHDHSPDAAQALIRSMLNDRTRTGHPTLLLSPAEDPPDRQNTDTDNSRS